MTVVLDATRRSAQERVAFWNDVVCETFVPSHVTPAARGSFHARVSVNSLGRIQLCTVDADSERVERTRGMIASSGRETLMLGLLERGGTARVEQRDRQAIVEPGELVLYDSRSPFTLEFDQRFRLHVFVVPHHCLGLHDDEITDALARNVRPEGAAALVPPVLRALASEAAQCSLEVRPALGQTAADLISLALRERLGLERGTAQSWGSTALIKAFIDQHLTDPELDPRTIARAHRMSVRSLHKLFESAPMTVGRLIQHRRLERARRALCAPTPVYLGVGAIAHQTGFRSPAHFTRSFSAAQGMTPSAYRAWATEPGVPDGPAAAGPRADRPAPGPPAA